MKELYLCGNEKEITEVINFAKNKLSKNRIFLIDLFPELKESYMEEHNIKRGWK